MKEYFLNFEEIERNLPYLKNEFLNKKPYPHLCLDNFLNSSSADFLQKHFPKENSPYIHEAKFYNVRGHSSIGRQVPEPFQNFYDEVTSDKFLKILSNITGIPDLKGDRDFNVGGLELGLPGAFSLLHTDPFVHYHRKNWQAEVTVLFYLSDDWKKEYNGQLQIWDTKNKKVTTEYDPIKGRCLIFKNSEISYHGYPKPLAQPRGIYRRAILLWYYTENNKAKFRPIKYIGPDLKFFNKALTAIENKLIWCYSFLRLHLGFNNKFALKISTMLRPK